MSQLVRIIQLVIYEIEYKALRLNSPSPTMGC